MPARFSLRTWIVLLALVTAAFGGCSDEAGSDRPAPVDVADAGIDSAGDADADAGRDARDADGPDVPELEVDLADEGDAVADADSADSADSTNGDLVDESGAITLDLVEGCNPFATSEECFFPYPSAFFQRPDETTATGVRLAYHNDIVELPQGPPALDFTAFNAADGAPPISPLLVHFGVDIHPDLLADFRHPERSVNDSPIAIYNLETGERVLPLLTEMDQNVRNGTFDGRHVLIIRPLEPMQMGARHLAVVTNDLVDTDGTPLQSPPAFAALRDGTPTTNAIIEDIRDDWEDHFAFLAGQGYRRSEILLAWDFVVASEDFVLGSVLSMRQQALEMIAESDVAFTIDGVTDNPSEHVARIVEGTFEVPTFITEDNLLEYDSAHHPILQDDALAFPFTLVIPAVAAEGDPLPLGVIGHGIFGTGRDMLTDSTARNIIHPLANEMGTVLVATDWIGLAQGDLDLLLEEVLPDLNRIRLVSDRLQQSLINTLVLTELAIGPLNDDPDVRVVDGPVIDPERVYYFGGSLGGIQGTSFVALSPRVERAVLAVPGGGWSHMINRSTVFRPIKAIADLLYPDPLSQQAYLALLQGFFDHSDPVNLSRLLFSDPLADAPAERVVVFQEAIGDCLVPNLTTRILARAAGVGQLTPAVESVYGLDPVTGPTTQPVLSQLRLPDNLAEYTPPDDNTLPAEDNGVHFEAVVNASNLALVQHLFETGEIEQFCDGPCDPD